MILSHQTIKQRCLEQQMVTPFCERTKVFGMTYGAGPAGYDVRIAESLTILPGRAALASTVEHFRMPRDVLGKVADKSTWARKFLAVQNTIIESGWNGFLTLELSNHGCDALMIEAGSPIAQIIFHLLDQPTDLPYQGKYQDQPRGAVEAILET